MARLTYRPVGAAGAYPAWLDALRARSGVYVIRDKATRRVLYVGESHKGNLTKTVTRHLQGWRRAKKWWSGIFGQQHDPGTTYPRGDVAIAAVALSPGKAVSEQARLIRQLKPRDNLQHATGGEAPF